MTSMKDLMGTVYRQSSKGADSAADDTACPARTMTYMKKLENASCFGRITGRCGETMEIQLRMDGEQITDIGCATDGCEFSAVCVSIAALSAKGKTVDEAVEIDGDSILRRIKDVPEEETHCARLAAETLQDAIHKWLLATRAAGQAGKK